MNDAATVTPTIPGTPFGGGFYAGRINVAGVLYALIVAPKDGGEHDDEKWTGSKKPTTGADSYNDGRANTLAMAAGGSKLAQWALGLRLGDHDDWHLPAQDELEVLYRAFKPTAESNSCWARSGINLSAEAPTRPYTPEFPTQTPATAFQEGGAEAFAPAWYWSSTQHAAGSACAWCQIFGDGGQDYYLTFGELRARAVRRLTI